MMDPCGCAERGTAFTPSPIANRPGLPALAYRIGTYATFFAAMKARLSGSDMSALLGLKTREANDPAIALCDAWAVLADILTFYQERIANEGYLRTATERRSVVELARLVGSSLRPGVSASTYLAYSLEQNSTATIPRGSRAQSMPAQGQRGEGQAGAGPAAADVRDRGRCRGRGGVEQFCAAPDQAAARQLGACPAERPHNLSRRHHDQSQAQRPVAGHGQFADVRED